MYNMALYSIYSMAQCYSVDMLVQDSVGAPECLLTFPAFVCPCLLVIPVAIVITQSSQLLPEQLPELCPTSPIKSSWDLTKAVRLKPTAQMSFL